MFQMTDAQSPSPPALFDFALPDSLRRARHAALAALAPSLAARGWTEPKFLLLNALVQAGEPLAQGVAGNRAGLASGKLRFHVAHLIEDGYIAWASPPKRQYPYIVARDIGRRQVNHLARELARNGARSWADLAALPDDVRVTERMAARLFTLLDRLTRACAGDDTETRANAPPGLPEPHELACVTLPLQARRARAALVKRIATVLRPFELSEAQWRILRILAQSPGTGWTVKGLGRRGCFHFGDPAVRRALVTLQARGLVRRSAVLRPLPWRVERKQPQRQFLAEITRAGLAMIDRIEAQQKIDNADLFARLHAAEMTQLERLLDRVTVALLWQDGLAADEQATHPFAAHYDRFDAYVKDAARAHERRNQALRQAGLPVRAKTTMKWWE